MSLYVYIEYNQRLINSFPRFYQGRNILKVDWNGSFKKMLTSLFSKIYIQKWDKNIYNVDKKSEISFETCCLLIFFNGCSSSCQS